MQNSQIVFKIVIIAAAALRIVRFDLSWSRFAFTPEEPHQRTTFGAESSGPRPPLFGGLGSLALVRTRVRLVLSHQPKRTELRGFGPNGPFGAHQML